MGGEEILFEITPEAIEALERDIQAFTAERRAAVQRPPAGRDRILKLLHDAEDELRVNSAVLLAEEETIHSRRERIQQLRGIVAAFREALR